MKDSDATPLVRIRRRDAALLIGASAALAASGCFDRPREKVVPYVRRPRDVIPGIPIEYATSHVIDGIALGLLATSREGRPIKVEGNPDHPASLGATRPMDQASVLELYDPERASMLLRHGEPISWTAFFESVTSQPAQRGLRFLLGPQSSPTIEALIAEVGRRHPGARFCFYAPLATPAIEAATTAIYGEPRYLQYDFSRARAILALDSDFAGPLAPTLAWARAFAARRKPASPSSEIARLYAVEPMPTPTGTLADHRLAIRSSDVAAFAAAILVECADIGRTVPSSLVALSKAVAGDRDRTFVRAVASDLARRSGDTIVIAGETQPVETHLLAHLLNQALGNIGSTVTSVACPLIHPEATQSFFDLVRDAERGEVETLVVLGGNPIHDAPADIDVKALFARAKRTVHLSLHRNETSALAELELPMSHYLESWGDARAHDGTLSYVQPLIAPRFDTRSVAQVLAAFAGRPGASDYDLVRTHWRNEWGEDFDRRWEVGIRLGLDKDSAFSNGRGEPRVSEIESALRSSLRPPAPGIELHFEPSPQIHDGRFGNSGWLQELPHQMTKVTWSNTLTMSPARAAALGASTGTVVEVRAAGRTIQAPAYVLRGHADDSVSIALGYGRGGSETLARCGIDVYPLRTSQAPHAVTGISLEKLRKRVELAITQLEGDQHGETIAPCHTLAMYSTLPSRSAELSQAPPPQWAMTIDTTICTGCSSCVIACQAENNIPTVGVEQVRRAREMHWLRIDRYFTDPGKADVVHQPMPCQHCEKAPCEYVCPVNATVHSPDGLNEMVYNRCIGTRFCSNNCPYKVRRFNWLTIETAGPLDLQKNPDVTVRDRGVMEKCTYCVQRIRRAERAAHGEEREIRPGEVVPACAQACPTNAITFGQLHHADTPMVKGRLDPRAYAVLESLGTQPRTRYLARIISPNPDIPR